MFARLVVCLSLFAGCLRPSPPPAVRATPAAGLRAAGGPASAKALRSAAYFTQVRQQVEDHWHPAEVYRQRDPSGSIYGRADRLAVVRIRLTPEGSLQNVAIEKPSGLEFLDELAIAAVEAAQPFPEPPPDLVNQSDNSINFTFGFRFDQASRSPAPAASSAPAASNGGAPAATSAGGAGGSAGGPN